MILYTINLVIIFTQLKLDSVEPTEVIYIEDYYYTNGSTTRPNGEYYSLYANDQLIDVTDGSFKLLAGLNYTFIAKENLKGGGVRWIYERCK